MTSWPTKKLGEVCEIISPGIKKFNSVKKYVATADVDFDKIINSTDITYRNRPSRANMETKENDVLVARMAETKKFLVVDKKLQDNYIFSTGFAVLRTKKELLPKYLFYFFTTKDFNLQKNKLAVGATQKAINNPALKRIKVLTPPLSIQRKIVERLDAIKKAQELNDKQIALADELFQSLLHRELDQKGKNWEMKKLENLVLNGKKGIKIGPFGSALKIGELIEKGPVRVIYIENVVNNEFDWSKEKYITGEKYKELTVYTVNPGDILVTIMGTIGRVCIVPKNIEKAIISSHLIKITPNKKIISSEFLYFSLLGSLFIKKQIIDQATGAIMSGLNSTILRNLKIPFPPIKTQRKIVEKLSAVQEYKKKLLEQKSKLQELFESVLNKSMKGELVK